MLEDTMWNIYNESLYPGVLNNTCISDLTKGQLNKNCLYRFFSWTFFLQLLYYFSNHSTLIPELCIHYLDRYFAINYKSTFIAFRACTCRFHYIRHIKFVRDELFRGWVPGITSYVADVAVCCMVWLGRCSSIRRVIVTVIRFPMRLIINV